MWYNNTIMSLPAHNSGEHASSTEFLKEYGKLIIDASSLIEKLGTVIPPTSESRTFNLERIEDPIKTPESIFEAIGEVNSATIAYDRSPEESSIVVELFGAEKSYRISRSTLTEERIDTVLDITPTDLYSAALLGMDEKPAHHSEPSDIFEDRIHNIPGIQNADFVRILLEIAQPDLPIEASDAVTQQLAATNPFAPEIYQSLMESSSINSQDEQLFSEYRFAADDSAALVYSQENGHPSYFQFTCQDSNGDPINIRGTLNKGVELDYPRHAVQKVGQFGEIDTIHSFPLSLGEIRHVRQLFKEEVASLPTAALIDEELVPQADVFVSSNGIDEELIGAKIENDNEEARIERTARHDAFNDEWSRFLDEQENDS